MTCCLNCNIMKVLVHVNMVEGVLECYGVVFLCLHHIYKPSNIHIMHALSLFSSITSFHIQHTVFLTSGRCHLVFASMLYSFIPAAIFLFTTICCLIPTFTLSVLHYFPPPVAQQEVGQTKSLSPIWKITEEPSQK